MGEVNLIVNILYQSVGIHVLRVVIGFFLNHINVKITVISCRFGSDLI